MKRRSLVRLLSASAVMTLGGVGYAARARSRNPYYSGPVTDHFDGIRFHSPGQPQDRGLVELARWQLGGGREPWPESYPSPFADKPPERVPDLRVALVGHATLLIQVAGVNILTDPVWSERASPVRVAGPKRANPPGIALKDLPPIDAILVTHNHYDHLDVATLSLLGERFQPRILAPLGNDAVIEGHDGSLHVTTRDWDGSVVIGGGVTVHLTRAKH